MALVDTLASIWAVDDSHRLPEEVDLIGLVSIGSTANRLSNGAIATMDRAAELLSLYNNKPPIVYGSFAGNGNRTIEEDEKARFFVTNKRYVGKVMTTIDECLAYKKAFPDAKKVIFVTEEGHSRRAKFIWECLWPEATIYVVAVKLRKTIDRDALMTPYRNAWKTLAFQSLPAIIYKPAAMLGPEVLKKLAHFHQPTST